MPHIRQLPCVRIHCSGGKRRVQVDFRQAGVEVEIWLEFNQRHRPAAALFVDGELRFRGDFPTDTAAREALIAAGPTLERTFRNPLCIDCKQAKEPERMHSERCGACHVAWREEMAK